MLLFTKFFLLAVVMTVNANLSPMARTKGLTTGEKIWSLLHPGVWLSQDYMKTTGICFTTVDKCPNENITFWFYSKETQAYPMQVDSNPETWKNIPVAKGKPWKVICHGFTCDRDHSPNPELRRAFYKIGEFNIISIDYQPLFRDPCYLTGTINARIVGRCSAEFLDSLISNDILPLKDLHIMGLSLGVHVAGQIGTYLKSGKVPHTTGLDPAMLLSYDPSVENIRINKTVAEFVDIIHSNAGFFGYKQTLGDVDFWPNGGSTQAGCASYKPPYFDVNVCSHYRSMKYYCESIITNKGFWSVPCTSKQTFRAGGCPANDTNQILMGYNAPETARGNYYLTTNNNQPFAKGKMT